MAPKRIKTPTQNVTSNPPPQNETGAGKEIQVTIDAPPPQKETVGREEIVVTMDSHSLECPICSDPLGHPVYQVMSRVSCAGKKLENKCPTCNKPIGGQNIALEAVLESMRLPCANANLGCCKSLSYSQIQLHKDTCEFTLSLCPIPGCAHQASSGQWLAHFVKDHWNLGSDYSDYSHHNYGESCAIRFDFNDFEEDRYYPFLGPGKDVFLLVKEAIPNVGSALTLYYIDLPDLGRNYIECKLGVQGGPYVSSSLQLESRVISIKEWMRGKVHGSFLLLPSLFLLAGYINVSVLLNKKKW